MLLFVLFHIVMLIIYCVAKINLNKKRILFNMKIALYASVLISFIIGFLLMPILSAILVYFIFMIFYFVFLILSIVLNISLIIVSFVDKDHMILNLILNILEIIILGFLFFLIVTGLSYF